MSDAQTRSAGVIIAFPDPESRPLRSAPGADEPRGEILLFTGVRYERFEPNPGPSRPSRGMGAGDGGARRLFVALALCAGLSACVEKETSADRSRASGTTSSSPRPDPRPLRYGRGRVGLPIHRCGGRTRGPFLALSDARTSGRFDDRVANLVRTRIVPPHIDPEDRAAYYRTLMGVRARSPASRYRRIGEDAQADAALIAPFAEVARVVVAADAARVRSIAHLDEVSEHEIAHAVARVAENRCLIAWVRDELAERTESYSYAGAARLFGHAAGRGHRRGAGGDGARSPPRHWPVCRCPPGATATA